MAKIEVEIVIPARYFLGGIVSDNFRIFQSQIADCLNLPADYVKIKR